MTSLALIGFEIGFVWPEGESVIHFYNPLFQQNLRSFWLFKNWV
jgi:hypothetical protein